MSSTQAAPFQWSQQPPSGNLQTFMSAYIDTMIIILYTKTMTVTSLTEKLQQKSCQKFKKAIHSLDQANSGCGLR